MSCAVPMLTNPAAAAVAAGCVSAKLLLGSRQGGRGGFSGGQEPVECNHERGGLGVGDWHNGRDDVPGPEGEECRAETEQLVSARMVDRPTSQAARTTRRGACPKLS